MINCRGQPTPIIRSVLMHKQSQVKQTTTTKFEPKLSPASVIAMSLASADKSTLAQSKASAKSSFSYVGRAWSQHIPSYLRRFEGRFKNRRRQLLYYFALFPSEETPMRGIVLYLHGIGDHCRRHIPLYERLCEEGFGVISYDLLNHGASNCDTHKTRAHIDNFRYLVDDTNAFITFAKKSIYTDALAYWREHDHPYHPHGRHKDYVVPPELPLIIAGTSLGSLIGLHTLLSGKHKFHAAVWAAPTLGVTWTPLLWAEAKLASPLSLLFPKAKVVSAVQYDLLCRDPGFLEDYKADPLTSMDPMTARSGYESLQAINRLLDDERVYDPVSSFCAVPTLFLAGSADEIADQQAAIKFFVAMGNLDKEFRLFDGLYHLVYEDPEREDVFSCLLEWLQQRFPVETRH